MAQSGLLLEEVTGNQLPKQTCQIHVQNFQGPGITTDGTSLIFLATNTDPRKVSPARWACSPSVEHSRLGPKFGGYCTCGSWLQGSAHTYKATPERRETND